MDASIDLAEESVARKHLRWRITRLQGEYLTLQGQIDESEKVFKDLVNRQSALSRQMGRYSDALEALERGI